MRTLRICFFFLVCFPLGAIGASAPAHTVYRIFSEIRNGFAVWIVDGMAVRTSYPEFLYGGNGERYCFVPPKEIWIDHAISAAEYEYTLAHEINERNLMARQGMSYADAHDSSLMLEVRLRHHDQAASQGHEAGLPRVSPTDCDGVKEILSLGDSIRLHEIYLAQLSAKDSVQIWIVDGNAVRRDIFPDFGFSGNDLAYHFIPSHEIWIDNAMGCEELQAAIREERDERNEMANGKTYDDAYEHSLHAEKFFRSITQQKIQHHAPVTFAAPMDRDVGTGTERPPLLH